MVVSPVSVLILVSVAAALAGGAEDNTGPIEPYDQTLEHYEPVHLVDLLRAKKAKCDTLKPCKKAGGKCTKKKDCDGKVKKVKKACSSKDCVCCISKKKPKCETLNPCKNAGGKCTKKKDCDGKVENVKKGCNSKDCVCCVPTPPPTTEAPSYGFDCDNGRVVPEFWRCDGFDDCGDGSDEAMCSSCMEGEHQCPSGQCIRESWKCDGFDDCDDASDEANCNVFPQTGGSNSSIAPHACNGFTCKNGRCIISTWKCDQWDDCGDNSDESDCNECSSSQFKCKSDGMCIRGDYKCDNYKDCADNSDESDCKVKCRSDQFQCVTSGKCIYGSWKCDDYKDCTDGSDEKDCKKCNPSTQFECKNKNCISSAKKCNGKDDCGDGSDEENCAVTCQCGMPNTQRIVGGTEVNPKRKYPWQIGLAKPGYYTNCGGSIINDRWILTAAHCITDQNTGRLIYDSSSNLKVLVGEHNQNDQSDNDATNTKQYSVKTFVKHPSYNHRTLDYDFALLEVTEKIPFNNVIRPVCLPKDDSKTYAGMTGTVSGWGRTSTSGSASTFLQEVQAPILTNDNCGSWTNVPAVKMCSGDTGKGSCNGDSGGPLTVFENNKYIQVGVVSHGHRDAGCGSKEYPANYARVSKILSWITTTTANGKKCD